MLFIIHCDKKKCAKCMQCEDHYPDFQQKLDTDNTLTLTENEFQQWRGPLDFARFLCKQDAISIERRRDDTQN